MDREREQHEAKKRYIGETIAGVASLIIFGRFVALFISGIAFIVVVRVLGPSVYGIYTLAIAFSGFFGGLGDLGGNQATNKFIGEYTAKENKEELERVVSNGYASVAMTGMFFTIVAFLLSSLIATYAIGNVSQTYVIQTVSFAIVAAMLFNLSYNVLIGFGKGRYVAILIIIQSVVQASLSITFAVLGWGAIAPILGMLIAYVTSITSALIIVTTRFKVRLRRPDFGYIKNFLKFSSSISVYNTLRALIWNLSPIVLGIFSTNAIVGNFGVALKTSNIISDFTDALATTLLPMFAYTLSSKHVEKSIGRFYNYAAYFTYVLITPALLYLMVLSKQFSYTVFSARYALAPLYISIISLGTLLWVLSVYTSMLLISANKVKELLKYSIIMVVIELLLLFTVVPLFNGLGLVIILFVISPVLVTVFLSRPVRKLLHIELEVRRLLGVVASGLISSALLVPLALFLTNYTAILVIGLAMQIVFYPIILSLTKSIGRQELKIFEEITKKIPVVGYVIRLFVWYSGHFVRD